jgi:chromosome partitioning protein
VKTITFSSIKGGTGKSSICILTANYAASAGYRVLVADLDIQNSATSYYLDEVGQSERKNMASALQNEHLAENIVPSNYPGVDIVASSFNLVKLRSLGEKTLSKMLKATPLAYDFLLIDTAPTYDNLVLNALNAADLILTPVAFSQFDYKGATFYRDQITVETEKLSAWRVLFNFYKPAKTDNPDAFRNQWETLFRDTFGQTIAPMTIPDSTLVRRSIDTGEKISNAAEKVRLYSAVEALADYCGAAKKAGRF